MALSCITAASLYGGEESLEAMNLERDLCGDDADADEGDPTRRYLEESKPSYHGGGKMIPSVKEIDLNAYGGLWYQAYASLGPNMTYEKDLFCITAFYEPGKKSLFGLFKEVPIISLTNAGLEGGPDGEVTSSSGAAWQFFTKYPAAFVLTMEPYKGRPIPPGSYRVIVLSEINEDTAKYEWAVVQGGRGSLFVLVRDIQFFRDKLRDGLLQALNDLGFNKPYNKPLETYHGPDCAYDRLPTAGEAPSGYLREQQ